MKETARSKVEGEQDSPAEKETAWRSGSTSLTHSDEETFELAQQIGERLYNQTIFLLRGDLGAGKTLFAKGIASGLGIDPVDVTSPTFTLINVYQGRLRLYHIDLYRLDEGACSELGLDEIFEDEKSVTIIEWAERLGFTPSGAIQVDIAYVSDTERKITINHPDGKP